MDTTTQGTAQPAAETGNGQPAASQQAPASQNQPAATPPANTQQPNGTGTPAPQQPSLEDLQRQVQELSEKARVNETSARHWQSQADRLRQFALGNQPQVDPIADKAKQYAQRFNLNEDDTRNILGILQAEIQPLAQRNQQLEAAMAGTSQIDTIMQTVSGDAQFGRFLQDPDVYQGVRQCLQEVALDGKREFVTANYAKDVARMLAFDKYMLNGQPAAPQPQAPQPMQFNGIMGPQGGYRPAQAAVKQTSPEVQFFNDEINQHFQFKKTT